MDQPLLRLARAPRRFLADSGGIAAVEMAFIAPIALGLLSLGVAGGQSLTLYHKVVLAAHSVTDLVSRTPYQPDPNNAGAELLPQSTLDADLALATMILYPHSTTNLTVVVSELKINATTNQGTVVWSEAYPSTATGLSTGTVIPLSASYVASGATYMLYGTVTYSFQPLSGIFNLPPITLTSTEILTIRNAPQITEQVGS